MGRASILYADNHLLALDKPAGVPTVPDASTDPSLLDEAKDWIRREHAKPGEVFLGVVHRLDRPVSGVVLFARTSKAAARLALQFRGRQVEKRYLALAEGVVRGDAGEIEQWLRKSADENRVRAVAPGSPGTRAARTAWRVLAREGSRTLLELRPQTGRPHQLRVAAAIGLGTPLLGDLKYGAAQPLADRSVALHARLLVVEHPTRHTPVRLCAPLPDRPWWRGWPALPDDEGSGEDAGATPRA